MVNELLVELVDRVLGTGKKTSRGNRAYHCPICNHHKPKLEINFTQNKNSDHPWHCWVCDNRGKKIVTLFKKINTPQDNLKELYSLTKYDPTVKEVTYTTDKVSLPKEFKFILDSNSILSRHARVYLKKRNITKNDIIKYNIGYCEEGEYAGRIVIPSYDENSQLNYFTARAFKDGVWPNYKNPSTSRDVVPFENLINWELPIILCEGPFDAIAIKRNVIPLLGKNIQASLMKKLVLSKVNKIYIALDQDAIKQALDFCEILLNQGKEVYLVELQGKDPSEMGFMNFTKLIQNVTPLNSFTLMEKKISLI
jgi:hypothetical protein